MYSQVRGSFSPLNLSFKVPQLSVLQDITFVNYKKRGDNFTWSACRNWSIGSTRAIARTEPQELSSTPIKEVLLRADLLGAPH